MTMQQVKKKLQAFISYYPLKQGLKRIALLQ